MKIQVVIKVDGEERENFETDCLILGAKSESGSYETHFLADCTAEELARTMRALAMKLSSLAEDEDVARALAEEEGEAFVFGKTDGSIN